jgi:hypothetical protein
MAGVWHVRVDGSGTGPALLTHDMYLSALTVGPGGTYWTDPNGVMMYAEGGLQTFVGNTNAQALTADDASVYWSDWGTNKPIYSEPFGVPATSPPAPLFTNVGTAFGLVFFQGNLYWTVNDTNVMQGLVMYGSTEGGTASPIAQNQANPLGISVDSTGNVYWANNGVDGDDAGAPEQAVMEKPTSTPAYALGQGLSHPVAVWADPNGPYVYWVEQGSPQNGYADGSVVRATKAMPIVKEVLATGQGRPTDITGDDTSIYWANAGALTADGSTTNDGQIMKLPK